jgi:hypothetical protein
MQFGGGGGRQGGVEGNYQTNYSGNYSLLGKRSNECNLAVSTRISYIFWALKSWYSFLVLMNCKLICYMFKLQLLQGGIGFINSAICITPIIKPAHVLEALWVVNN